MMEPAAGISQESSVSFGRFNADSLSWERWSSFSQNRYLEEVERCSIPGSVIQKKAYFEAHFKKIAAQKALLQQAQSESHSGNEINAFDESGHPEDMTGLTVTEEQNLTVPKEQNEELTAACYSLDFDSTPHGSDTGEGVFNMIDPNQGTSMGEKEGTKTRENSPSVMNIVQQQEISGSSSTGMVDQNGERRSAFERNAEDEALDLSEVGKAVSFEQEQQAQLEQERDTENVEMADGGMEKAEEKVVASKSDPKKPNQKKKLSKKIDASSGQKIVQANDNTTGTSNTKISSNAISRKSKVQVSSGPSTSSKPLSRAAMKTENVIVSRSKMAGGDATESKNSPISLHGSVSPGTSNSTFTVSQPFALATDKRVSTVENLGFKKQASKSFRNISSLPATPTTEVSANGAAKAAGVRATHQENRKHQKESKKRPQKQRENKHVESKHGEAESRATSAGSHPSINISKLDPKVSGARFSFKSDKRAEERKEFYTKLEEKLNAKETEMNQIQAKTQAELKAEIKLLRRSLNFKATPMPTFYQELVPPKAQIKKIPPTSAKLPKLARKNDTTASQIDSDGSSIPSHKTVSEKEIKYSCLVEKHIDLSEKNGKLPSASERTPYLKKAQKAASTNRLGGNNLKSKVPSNGNMKSVFIYPAETESCSTKVVCDELELKNSNVIEHPSLTKESNRQSVNMSYGKTQSLHGDSLLGGKQQDLTNDISAESKEMPDVSRRNIQVGASANSEMTKDKGESQMIANTQVKVELQKIDSAKAKVAVQKSNGVRDKDYNTGITGNGPKLKAKAQQHASPNDNQESKDRIIKPAKHD